MKKQITLLITVLLAACMYTYAQTNVKGTVTDSKNLPIPGATVKVKETGKAAATDINGNFTIQAAGNNTLIISSVGYTTVEEKVNGRNNVNVSLADDSKQLSDVVVIGYGTRAVKDVTGAITSVKAERLENENPTSVTDLIRGNIPGIQVAMNTSPKGGGSGDLTLRGKVSLSGSISPLIVLDGVIYPGQLADINVDDVERVDVLRDPSALAVYGAQSAGGVVAITTKKGKSGAPVIQINSNFGIAQLEKNQKVYQGTGFLSWRADVARATNTTAAYYLYSDPNNLPAGVTLAQFLNGQTGDPTQVWLNRLGLFQSEIDDYNAGKVTDWSKLIFRNGFRQDYTASMSGKNESVSYYMSGNFTKNQNLIQGGEYKDGRFRVNLEGKAAKFLTIGVNAQFATRDESNSANPFNLSGYDLHEADWGQILNASPYGDFYDPLHPDQLARFDTGDSGVNYRNPFLGNVYNQNVNINNVLFANLFARVDLPFGIKYTLNFAPQIEAYRNFFFRPVANPNEGAGGTAYRTMENRYRYTMDNILTWNKTFGIHNIDVTALLNKEKYQTWYTRTNNSQFSPSDALGYDNIGAGTLPIESSDDRLYTADGLMGRVNYTLMGKYILTGTIRRDGFSPFGLKNPRETYPSGAVAWVFSDEKFVKGLKWLDYGKLRVSYGANGNRLSTGTSDPSIALATLGTPKYPSVNGGTLTNNAGIYISNLQNENLKWERVVGTNIGLDFTVLHNRLSGSIDVYNRRTTDMLVKQSISNIQGYNYSNSIGSNNSSVYTNIGEVNNKGIEVSLDAKLIKSKNFNWSASGTFFLNRNKIVHLYGGTPVTDANGNTTIVEKDDIGNGWFIGHDINAVWDYKILGVWKTSEATDAAKYGAKPGDFKLEDLDGNFKFDNNDKQFLGTQTAKYSWSLRNDINFLHNFDFSFLLVSNVGSLRQYNQALNNPGSVGYLRMNSYVQPYWTPDNQIDDYARLISGFSGTTINVWRSSSFVRVQTMSLGYSFNKQLIKRIGIQSAKLIVNVSNLAVLTPWQFWDPQNDGPTPRYISAGFNVTL